jgi:ArsR family transcriptional regulator
MNTTALEVPILQQLHALGDEARARILALLERSEFTVGELCTVLGMAQPSVSRHLRTLADEGWVEARQEGRSRHYRLAASLAEPARALWRIVRAELADDSRLQADAERAEPILKRRRLRSTEFFSEAAERWDALRSELFGPAARLAPLIGLLDADWTVGDLGSGTGAMAETLCPFVGRVVGVDASESMLAAAAARLEGLANVELRKGELESLPVGDGELDVAVLALVLHYVVDPPRVLAEARRALRPGGRLVVMDMRRHEPGAGYAREMGHVWPGFELDRMSAWLSDAGFSAARVQPLPPEPDARGPLLFLASARREGSDAPVTRTSIRPSILQPNTGTS